MRMRSIHTFSPPESHDEFHPLKPFGIHYFCNMFCAHYIDLQILEYVFITMPSTITQAILLLEYLGKAQWESKKLNPNWMVDHGAWHSNTGSCNKWTLKFGEWWWCRTDVQCVTISFLSHVFFLICVVQCPYFSFTPSYKETNLYLLTFPNYSFPLLFPL